MYWIATLSTVSAIPLNSTTWFVRNYYTCLTLLGASQAITWLARKWGVLTPKLKCEATNWDNRRKIVLFLGRRSFWPLNAGMVRHICLCIVCPFFFENRQFLLHTLTALLRAVNLRKKEKCSVLRIVNFCGLGFYFPTWKRFLFFQHQVKPN